MLAGIGLLIAVGGLATEGVAVTAAAFYPIRRRLSWSPFELQSLGFFIFLAGVILRAVGMYCERAE
jgi:xanthine/uracil/vitamin C permease (AzgA family)